MSEILELLLELLLDLIGGVFEAMGEFWLADLRWPDTTGKRIFWVVVILLLVCAVWRDFH